MLSHIELRVEWLADILRSQMLLKLKRNTSCIYAECISGSGLRNMLGMKMHLMISLLEKVIVMYFGIFFNCRRLSVLLSCG